MTEYRVRRTRAGTVRAWGWSMAQETTDTMMEMKAAGFRPIPIPLDFPVAWEHPDEARLFWTRDRMHGPHQVPPIMEMQASFVTHGFAYAAEAYALPIRLIFRTINTYMYSTTKPIVPPEQMAAQGKKAEEKLGAAMADFNERWETEYLPEIKRHLALCERFDLPGATNAELLDHFDRVRAGTYRLWEIHFLLAIMFTLSPSLFTDLCADLFEDASTFAAYDFLQGLDNKSLETDRGIRRLSHLARATPVVRQVLEARAAADAPGALEGSAEGRAFLAELRAFLDEFGQRGNHFFDFDKPSWIEDPTPVIRTINDYMSQPDRDPAADLAKNATERERLVGEARARLAGYPQQVREQFNFLLQAAQDAIRIGEDHNYWIDCRTMYELRRVVLAMADRLVAARSIATRDDIFFLTLDEARATLADPTDRRALVEERKAEMARFAAVRAPHALGTEPPGPPPDNPMGRANARFWGGPPQESLEPGVLKGNAGSRGVVRGPAKVIHSMAEAGKLQPGDILVAETTAPPWTPLFATAAAVVTDTGGILSHCAVVAREYMIPAVVGVGMATAVIQDGQMLEVYGTAGTVRIIG